MRRPTLASARPLLLLLPLLSATSSGCGNDNGPLMRPGENCMTCHGPTPTGGERGPRFYAAGTVFGAPGADVNSGVEGITVTITDANAKKVTMTTNAAGNFYTSAPLTYPIAAEITKGGTTIKMSQTVPDGGCASCHTVPPQMSAPGRIYFN